MPTSYSRSDMDLYSNDFKNRVLNAYSGFLDYSSENRTTSNVWNGYENQYPETIRDKVKAPPEALDVTVKGFSKDLIIIGTTAGVDNNDNNLNNTLFKHYGDDKLPAGSDVAAL